MKDLRVYAEPSSDNPYFSFVREQDDWEFAIRHAFPLTVRKADVKPTQNYYYIQPKVAGVFDVLNRIVWQGKENEHLLDGAIVPSLNKCLLVRMYERFKEIPDREQYTS